MRHVAQVRRFCYCCSRTEFECISHIIYKLRCSPNSRSLIGWHSNYKPNQVGDTAGAIQHYELAGTHCVEVPRMLFERGRVEDLEEYITQVLPGHFAVWFMFGQGPRFTNRVRLGFRFQGYRTGLGPSFIQAYPQSSSSRGKILRDPEEGRAWIHYNRYCFSLSTLAKSCFFIMPLANAGKQRATTEVVVSVPGVTGGVRESS